ncbi:MAG: gliding motility-associated C-terminal domain-containing protein [Cyclobacteriaceae bacterium]
MRLVKTLFAVFYAALVQSTFGQCLTDFTKLVPEVSTDYSASFGASVSMHGNYLAVGVPGSDSLGRLTGVVNIYEKLTPGWAKIATLAPSDPIDAIQFGLRVKMSANYLLVGAVGYRGKVYVFKKPVSGWTSQTELTSFTVPNSSMFGFGYNDPLAISQDEQTFAIVDPDLLERVNGTQQWGAIFVYHKQPAQEWNNSIAPTKISPPETDAGMFGRGGVVIDEDRIITMTPFAPTGNGAIYIFRDPSGTFQNLELEARLTSGSVGESTLWMGNFVVLPEGIITYAGVNMDTQGRSALIYFQKPISGNWISAARTCAFNLNEQGISSSIATMLSTTGQDIFLATRDQSENGVFTKISKSASGWCSPVYETVDSHAPMPGQLVHRYGLVSSCNESNHALVGYVSHPENDAALSLKALTKNMSGEWEGQVIANSKKTTGGHRYGADILGIGDFLFVTAPNDGTKKQYGGAVYIYRKTAGSWVKVDKLTPPNITSRYDDVFGSALANNNEYLAIAASGYEPHGRVFIYKKTNADWSALQLVQEIELPEDVLTIHAYGDNVAMDDEWLIIPYVQNNPARIMLALYKFNGLTWDYNQFVELGMANIFAKSTSVGVSIEGNTILAGTSVLELGADGKWQVVAIMMPSDPEPMQISSDFTHWISNGSQFGFTVKLSNNSIFIGAPLKDHGSTWDVGAVYIYTKRPEERWTSRTETARILPRIKDEGELFGYSLAVLGNTLIAGAPGADFTTSNTARNKPGRAYVFQSQDYFWQKVDPLVDFTGDSFVKDYYGLAVNLDETDFIIGATIEDLESGKLSGSVYITPTPPILKLVPPVCNTRETIDLFGYPFGGTWTGPGLIDATEGLFDPKVAGPGAHEFTYRTPSCAYEGKLIIEVRTPVEAKLAVPPLQYVCAETTNISVPLSVQPVDDQLYQWYHRNVAADPFFPLNSKTPAIAGTQRGEYVAKVYNSVCESFSDVISVKNEKVVFAFAKPAEICEDSPGVALAITPSGGKWQGIGVRDNIFFSSGLQDGAYTPVYQYTSPINCKYDTSMTVVVNRLKKPTITRSGNLCLDGEVFLSIPPASNNGIQFEWKKVSSETEIRSLNLTGPRIQITEHGNYLVSVTNGTCTVQTDAIKIEDSIDPGMMPAENEIKVCDGNAVKLMLDSDPQRTFNWYYSETSDGETQLIQEAGHTLEASRSGYYQAIVISGACEEETGKKHISISAKDSVFIPNVITPTGDGTNDEFIVFSSVADIQYTISNRYGAIVYQSDAGRPWSGEHNSAGVYFWFAIYQACEGELRKLKGTVHLIK